MADKEIDFLIKYNGNIPSVPCNIENRLNKIDDQEITALIIKLINLGIGKMSMETFSQVKNEKEVTVIFNVSKQKISLSVPITDKDKTFKNVETLSYTLGSYKTVMVSHRGIEPRTFRLRVCYSTS